MDSPPNLPLKTSHSKRILTPALLSMTLLFALSGTQALADDTHSASKSTNQNSDLTDYVKSAEGCYVYQPKASLSNRVKWDGRCVDDYAEGQGIAEWYNNNQRTRRYQGNFIHGKLQGKGRIDWDVEVDCECEYDYYEGELKDSQPFGQGTMHFTNGNQYKGGFVYQGQTTTGIFTWGPGSDYYSDRYEGDFLDGMRQGKGVYTWGEYSPWAGDRYQGDYRKGQQHGYGIYTSSDGSRYEGSWQNNIKSGYGEMLFTDGSTYKGQWNNSFGTNYGIRTWPNGARYEGHSLDGAPHGYGKLTYASGEIYEGEFAYVLREGKGKMTAPSGAWVEVEFIDDKPYGKGINVRANGIRYKGQFRGYDAWGYGHLTVPKAAFDDDKRAKNGVWQGDTFVEKGWFYDNKFKFPCNSYEHCVQVAASHPEYQQYMD